VLALASPKARYRDYLEWWAICARI